MQVKRYEVETMHEAFQAIRKDLGPDAVILSTRRMTKGRKSVHEVVAARDDGGQPMAPPAGPAGALGPRGNDGVAAREEASLESLRKEVGDLRRLVRGWGDSRFLYDEIRELREACCRFMDILGSNGKDGSPSSGLLHRLVANGLSRERALCLVENAMADLSAEERKNPGILVERLKRAIEKDLSPSGKSPPGKRIQAVVGPAGSGKTTTLAKLAARAACEDHKKVAFITTDTCRLAAVEQLRIYAKIMGVPLEVAAGREAMERSLHKWVDFDFIFVDTPGKSLADPQGIGEIKKILEGHEDMETSIVLSLTSNRDHFVHASRTYGDLHMGDRVILTKLDECRRPGIIYDIAAETGKSISYVANGQNVPRDIEVTTPAWLSELVLGCRSTATVAR